jgi:hypothetical protein
MKKKMQTAGRETRAGMGQEKETLRETPRLAGKYGDGGMMDGVPHDMKKPRSIGGPADLGVKESAF